MNNQVRYKNDKLFIKCTKCKDIYEFDIFIKDYIGSLSDAITQILNDNYWIIEKNKSSYVYTCPKCQYINEFLEYAEIVDE